MVARRAGVNPVWYVDITDGHDWRLRNALNNLVAKACSEGWFDQVADVFPAIEYMRTRIESDGTVATRNEWWWEREWRHIDDLDLTPIWDKILWLCPEDEIANVEILVRNAGGDPAAPVYCIDPNWSLERIIGRLMGLTDDDLTPFGAR